MVKGWMSNGELRRLIYMNDIEGEQNACFVFDGHDHNLLFSIWRRFAFLPQLEGDHSIRSRPVLLVNWCVNYYYLYAINQGQVLLVTAISRSQHTVTRDCVEMKSMHYAVGCAVMFLCTLTRTSGCGNPLGSQTYTLGEGMANSAQVHVNQSSLHCCSSSCHSHLADQCFQSVDQ